MTNYSNATLATDMDISPGWEVNNEKEKKLKQELELVRQRSLEIVRMENQGIPELLTYAGLTIKAWQINQRLGCVDDR